MSLLSTLTSRFHGIFETTATDAASRSIDGNIHLIGNHAVGMVAHDGPASDRFSDDLFGFGGSNQPGSGFGGGDGISGLLGLGDRGGPGDMGMGSAGGSGLGSGLGFGNHGGLGDFGGSDHGGSGGIDLLGLGKFGGSEDVGGSGFGRHGGLGGLGGWGSGDESGIGGGGLGSSKALPSGIGRPGDESEWHEDGNRVVAAPGESLHVEHGNSSKDVSSFEKHNGDSFISSKDGGIYQIVDGKVVDASGQPTTGTDEKPTDSTPPAPEPAPDPSPEPNASSMPTDSGTGGGINWHNSSVHEQSSNNHGDLYMPAPDDVGGAGPRSNVDLTAHLLDLANQSDHGAGYSSLMNSAQSISLADHALAFDHQFERSAHATSTFADTGALAGGHDLAVSHLQLDTSSLFGSLEHHDTSAYVR